MKKFLSAALASAMVVSMAVSAAALTTPVVSVNETPLKYTEDAAGVRFGDIDAKVSYGSTVFYAFSGGAAADAVVPVTEYDAVKGTTIKQKWELNGTAVEKIEIVKKKVDSTKTDYAYYLSVKTKDSTSIKDADLIGTITLRKSGTGAFTDLPVEVNFTLGYATVAAPTVVEGSAKVMFDPALTGDQTITFAKASDNYFDVNVDGQGKLLVKADVKYNADIAAKYPAANLDFFTGNGASFNKIGELTIAAAPGSFLYTVTADGVVTAVKATYDEYEEAFKVKTRTLGAYVISDVELKSVVAPTTPEVKPNPGTGANA